jgi:tetratricopeptide (TPR) repeat protein
MMLTFMGRLDEAERDLTEAIRIARRGGRRFSWMHASLVDAAAFGGRAAGAMREARAAVESAEEYGSPYFTANAHRALGVAHLLAGEPSEAIVALEHALELIHDSRTALHLEPVILARLAEAYLATGDAARARASAEAAVSGASKNNTRAWECLARLSQAEVLWRTEGAAAAPAVEAELARVETLIEATGAESFWPHVLRVREDLARVRGDRKADVERS